MTYSEQEIEEFKAESFDLLEFAEKSLLALDDGFEFRPAFDSIFRGLHNLKGAAGMMDLLALQAHTHSLETILMGFKDATAMPKEYIDLFLRGIDAARLLLNGQDVQFDFSIATSQATGSAIAMKQEDNVPNIAPSKPDEAARESAENEFFLECGEIVERVSDALQLIESQAYSKETLEALYRDIHSLKGSAYLFSFTSLGDIAHKMESSLEKVREGTHSPSKSLVDQLFVAIQFIEKEIDCLKSKIQNPENATKNTLAKILKDLELVSGKLALTTNQNPEERTDHAAHLSKEKEGEAGGSIRVSVSLLDNLMTLMGEMVLVRNQVIQFSSKSDDLEFLTLSKRLNVVTSEIQAEMMKTRMQPIGNILSKFNRVVRDLSQELNKDIVIHLFGSDTELDKSLLEAIKDPLTHIVRNSCDHGIEAPDIRVHAGKSRNGTINIHSYHEGGQVVIEIKDDGKGLNKDILLKKAIEKSIITQSQAAVMGEKEIFNLIFAPGFSTAAQITNVSGRGVGMDVVRTNVEKIGGSVELLSVLGKGTTTKLKIPLTLAIVPALVIKCGGGTFAIPQVKLEELVRVDQSSNESKIEILHGTPVFRLRGQILPLVSLNKILGYPSALLESCVISNIAVLNADQCSFGLIVDEIQDTADIVVKPINRLLKSLQVFSGATILGDGSIALILDVFGISKVAHVGSENAKSDELSNRRSHERKDLGVNEFQEYLLVNLNSPTKHAIVLGYVHRLEEFKTSKIEYSGNQPLIRYGDTILPIISISEKLGLGTRQIGVAKEEISVVVIQKAGILYGLEVEEILDTLSTDVEMTDSFVKQVGVFGNLNTSDELIVVVDPFELIGLVCPEVSSNREGQMKMGSNQADALGGLSPHTTSLQILLVEDTAFFRKAIARVLAGAGHEITTAFDGKEAVEILEKNPKKFNLIVSDIEMPRLNGFEMAKEIRKSKDYANIPLLAISSRADKKHIDEGKLAGFDIYLEKLKPELLLSAVEKLTTALRRVG